MKKFFVKENLDYLILAIGVVVTVLVKPLNIVVNHYMHTLSVPVGLAVASYGVYIITKKTTASQKWKTWYKWVGLGAGVACVLIWSLGIKQPSQRACLGTATFVAKSDKDIKQVAISEDIEGYDYVLFFNPNCETCQDVIPRVLDKGKTKKFDLNIVRQNIVFVDTTQDYGKKLASDYDVETVPSYMYVGGKVAGDPKKLGYHTDNGTKFLEKEIVYLKEMARFRTTGKEYKE